MQRRIGRYSFEAVHYATSRKNRRLNRYIDLRNCIASDRIGSQRKSLLGLNQNIFDTDEVVLIHLLTQLANVRSEGLGDYISELFAFWTYVMELFF